MPLSIPARALLFAAACIAALPGAAQPAPSVLPNPFDAKASVPALRYESAFTRFRRGSDDKPISWRQANDTVNGIGGWRVYAREAQQGDAAPAEKTPAAAPTPATAPALSDPAKPMPGGHGGHKAP